MSKSSPVESQNLFSYELRGEPSPEVLAEQQADFEIPELTLDGPWNPAAYREMVTNMMKEQYESDPKYYEYEKLCSKEEISIPARDGNDAPGRMWIYRPPALQEDRSAPAIVYIHGGGSVAGSLEDFGPLYAEMAIQTETVVCAVSYRMVPFVQYPFTVLDSFTSFLHVAENAASLGIDADRIALSGDSAGGYQVLAVLAQLAEKNLSHLVKLARVSVSQIFDFFYTFPKEEMNETELGTVQESVAVMEWMAGEDVDRHLRDKNPHLFPGLASDELLAKYPPMIVIEQEFDNYRRPSELLAERLRKAGRLLEYICYPGCSHMGGHPNAESDLVKMFDVYLKRSS